MAIEPSASDPFGWKKEGVGLAVSSDSPENVAHEVLFEDSYTRLHDRPQFVGASVFPVRLLCSFGIAAALLFALLGRAFWMQGIQGEGYRLRAEDNRLRREVIPAKRGIIRDRNGAVLAENIPTFDVQAIPWLLPKDEKEREDLLAAVARRTNQSLSDLQTTIASSTRPDDRVTLVHGVSYEQAIALAIDFADAQNVSVVNATKRKYATSPDFLSVSHVLGYVGPISREELTSSDASYRQTDVIGKTGVEASFEDLLRGKDGERQYEVDARNRVTTLVGDVPAVDGKDLTLTLDLRLQRVAEASLRKELAIAHVSRGAVVALDPRDGSILAAVSLPAYDDNQFSGTVSSTYYAALLQNEDRPLVPRAWAGVYPSGSTIKPVIATAALAEGVITPDTTVNSTGGIHIGSSFFPDWKAGGHGITNVRRALAWSVNTFFYYVGGGYESFIGLGVDRLSDWMKRFGFGAKTGVDLPGESAGFVPTKEWKERVKGERWYIGDTYNLSIGQGDLLVTPLQIAVATAEVADGGKKITPHIAKNVQILPHSDGTPPSSEKSNQGGGAMTTDQSSSTQIADPAVIRTVQLGMRDTVIYGSGRALSSFPVHIAGKTGTAQWRNDKPNHAWFTAYAPFENPEIVVTVLLEEGVEGSLVAVPVAHDVLEEWRLIRS